MSKSRGKLYIAASFTEREMARAVKAQAEQRGFVITSRWLNPAEQNHENYGTDAKFAHMDLEDCCEAHGHLQLIAPGTRGGRHTELGVALAFNQVIVLVGEREQVFHYHRNCVVTDNVDKALDIFDMAFHCANCKSFIGHLRAANGGVMGGYCRKCYHNYLFSNVESCRGH